ncbi:MAG: hypothetical protein Rubg2KO_32460 [Rubricoccaceae bacterium]
MAHRQLDMRLLWLLCVCALAATSSAQVPDSLEARSYVPLSVGNAWEYKGDLFRPRHPSRPLDESRIEYLHMEVTAYSVGQNPDHLELALNWFSEDSQRIEQDTFTVWYDAESASIQATYEINPDGSLPRFPFFLNGYAGFGGYGLPVEINLDELLGSGGTVPGTEFGEMIWNYTAAQDLGYIKASGGCHPCSSFNDYDEWSLTFAQIGTITYGARMVSTASSPSPPARLAVYPNPANDWITVEGRGRQFEVLDALGRRVERVMAPRSGVARLDIRRYPPGVYLLRWGAEAALVTIWR